MAMSAELRQEMRMRLAAQMRDSMRAILPDGTGDDPQELYDIMLATVIGQIAESEIQNAARVILGGNDGIKQLLLSKPVLTETKQPHALRLATLESLYDRTSGIEVLNEVNGKEVPETIKTTKGAMRAALENPEKLAGDAETLMNINVTGDINSRMEQVREMTNALAITRMFGPYLQNIEQVVAFVQRIPDSQGQLLFREFFRDMIVLDKLTYFVSEKIQNRFAKRFMHIGKTETNQKLAIPFLNSVGEFLLVSMGVIQPELMVLKKGNVDDEQYNECKRMMEESGIDLDALMRHYNLKTKGSFWFHRWAVKGQRSSAVTDEQVLSFITTEIRACGPELLQTLNFDELVDEVRNLQAEYAASSAKEDRADFEQKLRELLVKHLTSKEAEGRLVQLIKNRLFPAFIRFMDAAEIAAKAS